MAEEGTPSNTGEFNHLHEGDGSNGEDREDNQTSAGSTINPHEEAIVNGDEKEVEILKNLTAQDVMGRKFNTGEEAYSFYKTYARAWGFSVRIDKKTYSRTATKEMLSQAFVCSSAGTKRQSTQVKQRASRINTRFNCNAKMRVHLDKSDSKWFIDVFNVSHSHDPVPQKWVHHMRSHRGLDEATKAIVWFKRDGGMRSCDIMNQHVQQAGGYNKVGHTIKDLHNFVSNDREERISDGDAAIALAFLKSKLSVDENFVLEYNVNEDRLHHLFWADSMSMADMSCFGELLAFDTTYKKNIYNMPLVVFSGINHHFKSCIFGTAFLANEMQASYDWVLGVLKKAMGDKEPHTIVTDGDKAMRNAIQKVFPTATHRLCSWHIARNIYAKNKRFEPLWKKFIYANLEPLEFEEQWSEVVEQCSLQNSQWVSDLFDRRGEWAYTYLRSYFFAGLSTTSRCEGLNSQLGRFVTQNHNLLEFFIHFDRWMRDLREKEVKLDFKSNFGLPQMKHTTLRTLEESGSKLFSNEIFLKFQEELGKVACCIRRNVEIDGDLHSYQVTMFGKEKIYDVNYDLGTKKMKCSCANFEYMGIPCRHMMFLLKEENISTIPEELVLKRWTRNPKAVQGMQLPQNTDDVHLSSVRYGMLQYSSLRLWHLGANSPEAFQFAQKEIANLCDKLALMQTSATQRARITIPEEFKGVLNPLNVRYKGGKSPNKKSTKKPRKCGRCGGERHYQNNCDKPVDDGTDKPEDSTNAGPGSQPRKRPNTRTTTKQPVNNNNAQDNTEAVDGSDNERQKKRPATRSSAARKKTSNTK